MWERAITAVRENIEEAESLYGIKFPIDYLDVVRENQGRIPDPNMIKNW